MLCASALWGAIIFPTPNNSHVVDEAGLFSASQKVSLEGTLSAHQSATTNQIVIVTLTSLQGYDIADFGYQLGRAWGIGTKEHNNGVLLIIAPNERKVRIEVGYGLEGALPDAIASSIIQNTILPSFKEKNYFEGATHGVNEIIKAIKGEYKADETTKSSHHSLVVPLLFFVFIVFNAMLSFNASNQRRLFPSLFASAITGIISWSIFSMVVFSVLIAFVVFLLSYLGGAFGSSSLPSSWGSSSSGSSSSGGFGGFSGGGGSFGGGGASGSW